MGTETSNCEPPNRLFKYCPPERTDILTNERIRFTPPNEFNDPFELLPRFSTSYVEREYQDSMRKAYAFARPGEQLDWPKFMRKLGPLAKASSMEYGEQIEKWRETFSADTQSKIARVLGILTLSAVESSLLMWAHYARNHTGFVLELDATHDFFKPPAVLHRVEYVCERPIFEPAPPQHLTFLETMWHKSEEWSYEKEWRLIRFGHELGTGNPSHLVALPMAAVKAVYFGARCTTTTRSVIAAASQREGQTHIRLHHARLEQERYALRFFPWSNPPA